MVFMGFRKPDGRYDLFVDQDQDSILADSAVPHPSEPVIVSDEEVRRQPIDARILKLGIMCVDGGTKSFFLGTIY